MGGWEDRFSRNSPESMRNGQQCEASDVTSANSFEHRRYAEALAVSRPKQNQKKKNLTQKNTSPNVAAIQPRLARASNLKVWRTDTQTTASKTLRRRTKTDDSGAVCTTPCARTPNCARTLVGQVKEISTCSEETGRRASSPPKTPQPVPL